MHLPSVPLVSPRHSCKGMPPNKDRHHAEQGCGITPTRLVCVYRSPKRDRQLPLDVIGIPNFAQPVVRGRKKRRSNWNSPPRPRVFDNSLRDQFPEAGTTGPDERRASTTPSRWRHGRPFSIHNGRGQRSTRSPNRPSSTPCLSTFAKNAPSAASRKALWVATVSSTTPG